MEQDIQSLKEQLDKHKRTSVKLTDGFELVVTLSDSELIDKDKNSEDIKGREAVGNNFETNKTAWDYETKGSSERITTYLKCLKELKERDFREKRT